MDINVINELNRIQGESPSGLLMPQSVVDAARKETSPLHPFFEWDDRRAAREHRLDQARALISSYRIEVPGRPGTTVQAFVSLPADRQAGGGYRPIGEVINSAFMANALANDIAMKVRYWQAQAANLGLLIDFEPVTRVADTLLRSTKKAAAPRQQQKGQTK